MPTYSVINLIDTTPTGPTARGSDGAQQAIFLR